MIQKLRSNMDKKNKYRMVVVAVLVLAMIGTFLPGFLLVWQSKEQMNMVDAVPVEYYSPANLAVARNASANLGTYQKLQLITGRWDSNVSRADSNEREMENYEAVELAKEQMNALYLEGMYPVSLLSDYENWYSWEAEFCKVVDATFNTYAAYYWKLTFVKYDGSEKHCVYMLEDGTIFLAEAFAENGIDSSAISKISEIGLDFSVGLTKIVAQKGYEDNIKEYLLFADVDVDASDLEGLAMAKLQVNDREYYVLQANSANRYLFSLQPVN